MKKLEINLSDKDYSLLSRIAKSEGRRLTDLTYLLLGKGLEVFFCETLVYIEKDPDEYSAKDLAQMKKNAELEKTKGWTKLDWEERKAKGYDHVSSSLSNHVHSEELGRCHDPLIEPLAERIESYATSSIREEVK
tara:strand:- start:855 stop:1259 length:405 start_codon:yes stop_codon:yes gene_type:complete